MTRISLGICTFENTALVQPFWPSFYMDLLSGFSRFRQLSVNALSTTRVIPPSSFSFTIAGSFQKKQDTICVHVCLMNQEDSVIRGEQYTIVPDSDFTDYTDLVKKMVATLHAQLNHYVLCQARRKKKGDLTSYDYWLLGMAEVKQGTRQSDESARRLFEKAIEGDPASSLGYSGMSLTYFNEWSCQVWDRWDISQKGASEWAKRAIDIDDHDCTAALILGRVYLYEADYSRAEQFLRRALQLNGSDMDTLVQIASCFVFLGYTDEAEQLYAKVVSMNSLLADRYNHIGAFIALEQGRFNECVRLSRCAHAAWVDSPAFLAAAYFELGDHENMQQAWNAFLTEFKIKILQVKEPEQAINPVQWIINVNPFRHAPRMTRFLNFISGEQAVTVSLPDKNHTPLSRTNTIRKMGDVWEIVFEDELIHISDSKGMLDLAHLLEKPGQAFHCTNLMPGRVVSKAEPVFDERTKRSYQKRINDLRQEIQFSEDNNDLHRSAMLQQEYDTVVAHLSRSLGLRGRVRKTHDALDKTRSAVTWRIRNTIRKLDMTYPSLGRHLSLSVKTGLICCYSPEKPTHWHVSP